MKVVNNCKKAAKWQLELEKEFNTKTFLDFRKDKLNISFQKEENDITYIIHCNKLVNNQGFIIEGDNNNLINAMASSNTMQLIACEEEIVKDSYFSEVHIKGKRKLSILNQAELTKKEKRAKLIEEVSKSEEIEVDELQSQFQTPPK
jgi:hypothetical protein